ncbi:MAG TPA: GNAT family protein [Vicinamibacterales bacterium]|nr:GNAT family protein [Vicinamibacterales bacterium]
MANETTIPVATWRAELPLLAGRTVVLREPAGHDLAPLFELLSNPDASRFGIDEPLAEYGVQQMLDRAAHDREMGFGFTYAITLASALTVVGLVQVRQLDPAFEAAEIEITVAPAWRGTGVFLESARLVGSFIFGSLGTHRLEARVLLQNGRANGALRKLGAVEEGILRRSIRRGGAYVDQVLWSILKDDWGGHWVAAGPRVH